MRESDAFSPPTHPRLLLLDGLRGIAAIAVVLCHFSSPTARTIAPGAGLAVDLFFCLSGYVLAETYGRRLANHLSASEFMIRRLVRLYPLFLMGVVIGFGAEGGDRRDRGFVRPSCIGSPV